MSNSSLTFLRMGIRNFLSFGPKETVLALDGDFITVIIGENRDTGGEDSRNGVGKSAIVDALCYILFGKVIRGISNQKLINKLSTKGQMVAWVEFKKDKWAYRIERCERPGKLFLYRKPVDSEEAFDAKEDRKRKFDIARGKTETTAQIEEILGFDITLFEYLVANSSESVEFFRLTEEKQRGVVEPLFGFTIMTEKAKLLKEERKEKNKELVEVESAAEATRQANERIETEIKDLQTRADRWETQKANTIAELRETIAALEAVDVETEVSILREIDALSSTLRDAASKVREAQTEQKTHLSTKRQHERDAELAVSTMESAQEMLESLDKSECPTCHQHWESDPSVREETKAKLDDAEKLGEEAIQSLDEIEIIITENEKLIESANDEKQKIEEKLTELKAVELTYQSVEDAASATATLTALATQLKNEDSQLNPHTDSISSLRDKAIKVVDDTEVQSIRRLIKHYNYLIDLLTKKDSFLRQRIIDRWLPILNRRIAHWLDILELPHQVEFQPDLSITITNYHEDFDYGNLSRGERTRLRVSLNFAFQDVFEYMNYSINMLAVDELIDSGICPRGAENAVKALQEACRNKNKRIFLITHRDDVAARVDDVMHVIKENHVSRIEHETS